MTELQPIYFLHYYLLRLFHSVLVHYQTEFFCLSILNLLMNKLLDREQRVSGFHQNISIVDFDLWVGVLWQQLQAGYGIGLPDGKYNHF